MARLLALAALLLAFASGSRAHDIPDEVRVQAFVKPEGQTLKLLVRVPLKAMRDVDVPQRRGGFLDFSRVDTSLRDAATLWLVDEIELYEDDTRLARPRVVDARVSLESDRSFASYERALAHLKEPRLRNDTELYWNQGLLDVLLEYPIRSERSDFSIRPRLERLGIKVNIVLRFLPPGGRARAFDLHGDPGLVRLDPSSLQAALRFIYSGFLHILEGTDHLLFVLCLVVPFRRFWPLAAIVTAFTVAHSITLIMTALGHGPDALWFPPLIGFGFAYGLQQLLQFAGSHLITSLLAFNLGVELGQLLVLIVLVPALSVLFRYIRERVGTIIISLLVGHTAWHWLLERWDRFSKFPSPTFDAGTLASAIRWLMALLVLVGLAWIVAEAIRRSRARRP